MKNYIPSLTGLRALSILMVMCSHINYFSLKQRVDFKYSFFFNGELGVTIFFVISGFLITTLLLEEEKVNGEISIKKFYLRRILRIFPAYYFLLLFYFILQCMGIIYIHRNAWLTSITYTKYFPIPHGIDHNTGHFWSLSVEEHFYLFWPFVFKFLKKYRIRIAWMIIIVTPFLRILGSETGSPWLDQRTIFQTMDALMIGCMFAIYKNNILAFLNRLVSISKVFIYMPILVLIILHYIDAINVQYNLHMGILTVPFGTLGTLGFVTIGFIIVTSSNFTNNVWFSFLNNPVMIYIGKISYSLYLWQQIFISSQLKFFSNFPVNLVFVFLTACFSYHFIEKPFLKLKLKFERV